MIKPVVLDASALIALIYQEKGMDIVEKYLPHAQISTVNLSEVIAYMIKKGFDADEGVALVKDLSLTVIDFDASQAMLAGQLISVTASKGLSLGDRACLALAIQKNLPALTADKAWASLSLKVKIELIR